MYPILPDAFKQRFPFRLSVPSFVYPADYVTNVRRLGPFVDEIELLLFESLPESLPSRHEIDHLAALAHEMRLTYNVHLPIDLDLSSSDPETYHHAIARISSVLALVRPLAPTTHTLHLACSGRDHRSWRLEDWQSRTLSALTALIQTAAVSPGCISIETLDYPPTWFAPLITQLDLTVCVDAGHILRYGFDLQSVLDLFGQRISICHLHGVDQAKDHLGLDKLAPRPREILRRFLQDFRGSVSLEVFSFDPLRNSLRCLAEMLNIG